MSDTINIREELARIDHERVETRKLIAETDKLIAESRKLNAEARKFSWDPWMLLAGAVITGAFLRLPELLAAFGLHR